MGYPPWHMWGTSGTLVLDNGPTFVGSIETPSVQLSQINYGRPETWKFWFAAEITHVTGFSGDTLICEFSLTFGLGRTTIKVPADFLHFDWSLPADTGQRYLTSFPAPPRFAADARLTEINHLTASNIQVAARLRMNASANVGRATVTVTSLLAPESHIRPEWFMGGDPHNYNRYRGGENGGM